MRLISRWVEESASRVYFPSLVQPATISGADIASGSAAPGSTASLRPRYCKFLLASVDAYRKLSLASMRTSIRLRYNSSSRLRLSFNASSSCFSLSLAFFRLSLKSPTSVSKTFDNLPVFNPLVPKAIPFTS